MRTFRSRLRFPISILPIRLRGRVSPWRSAVGFSFAAAPEWRRNSDGADRLLDVAVWDRRRDTAVRLGLVFEPGDTHPGIRGLAAPDARLHSARGSQDLGRRTDAPRAECGRRLRAAAVFRGFLQI